MQNILIKHLRTFSKITYKPIIYKLWVVEEGMTLLLRKLKAEVDVAKLKRQGNFYLLYIGCGKNGNERLLRYHILDSNKFHVTGITNGRLSSLRQTICGLMGWKMSSAQKLVDSFFDDYCVVTYYETNLIGIKDEEKNLILENYLPLNYHYTKLSLSYIHRKILRDCKRKMRN
jgi:hypothetical protein